MNRQVMWIAFLSVALLTSPMAVTQSGPAAAAAPQVETSPQGQHTLTLTAAQQSAVDSFLTTHSDYCLPIARHCNSAQSDCQQSYQRLVGSCSGSESTNTVSLCRVGQPKRRRNHGPGTGILQQEVSQQLGMASLGDCGLQRQSLRDLQTNRRYHRNMGPVPGWNDLPSWAKAGGVLVQVNGRCGALERLDLCWENYERRLIGVCREIRRFDGLVFRRLVIVAFKPEWSLQPRYASWVE